jgi:hypothetical protein
MNLYYIRCKLKHISSPLKHYSIDLSGRYCYRVLYDTLMIKIILHSYYDVIYPLFHQDNWCFISSIDMMTQRVGYQ